MVFVFDPGYSWLALETTVTILEELAEDEFLKTMADEGRLIYEFEVQRTYGMH